MIAPYATALAAMVDPGEAAANLRRLAREGAEGATASTRRSTTRRARASATAEREHARRRPQAVPVAAYFAHHQGMALVALANAVLDGRHGARASTPTRASRRPSSCCRSACRASCRSPGRARSRSRASRRRSRRRRRAGSARPHTRLPARRVPLERPLRLGGHQRRRRLQHLPRPLGDPAARGRGVRSRQPVPLPARRAERRRVVGHLSADPPRARRVPGHVPRRQGGDPAARRGASTPVLEIAVSPEDDVEVRRLSLTNRSPHLREIEITSYVEVALRHPAEDLAHPAFGKLFLETECRPETSSLLCGRRQRSPDEPGAWAMHVLSMEGRQPERGGMGDRPRALHRPRARHRGPDRARRPAAVRHHRRDARSDPEPAPAHPARARAASRASPSPPAWPPTARRRSRCA